MKCRDVQKLLLDQLDETLTPDQQKKVECHIEKCDLCGSFLDDRIQFRKFAQELSVPALSPIVEMQTRNQCHDYLHADVKDKSFSVLLQNISMVPNWIWAAFILGVSLFMFWVLLQGKNLNVDQGLSSENIQALIFILQNITMLILAPILIKRYQRKDRTQAFPVSKMNGQFNHI